MRKNNFLLILLYFNLIMVGCQSKANKIDLSIFNESNERLILNKKKYQLESYNFVDSLHSRIVLKNNDIKTDWQPFKNEILLDYMDLYFNQTDLIGYKGTVSRSENSEELFNKLVKTIENNRAIKKIEIRNTDSNILYKEWELNDKIIGLKYEKPNNSTFIIIIKKNEVATFYNSIFYNEFLDLTKNRVGNDKIHLKNLKSKPSNSDKEFYKEKFKDLKDDYNKKYNGK